MRVIAFSERDLPFTKFIHIIHQLEKVRNTNFLRASIHTVPAAGAGNGFFCGNNSGNSFHKLFFPICEQLEVVHVGKIILHLFRGGHARQHHRHVGQTGSEPHRPGRNRHIRLGFLEQFLLSGGTLDSKPPLTGSMTSTGLLCLTAAS